MLASRHVLVVDDEPLIRMGLQDVLEEEGFSVAEANCAADALRALKEQPSIEIMISDVKMPGMDGLELAQLAADQFPGLKIIIMSGHANAHDPRIPECVQFMRKPFPLIPFAQRLREGSHDPSYEPEPPL